MSVTTTEQVFHLPDLGEGLTEAEIVEWKVAVGDTIGVDQVVVEVETAKAAVEVPCPYAGRVVALHAPAGQVLDVGRPLLSVAPVEAAPAAEPAEHARYREEERAGSGNVLIGYGTGHAPRGRRRRVLPPAPTPAAPARAAGAAPVRVISPIVRRLAREHGLELAGVRGTGAGGVICRRDVEAALSAPSAPSPAAAPPAPPGPADDVRVPLRGARRTVAEKLARSRREIPDATTWVDVDATALLEAKAALGVGVLALLARICVAGLREFPQLNAFVDTEREEVVQLSRVHLGFAAQTPRGLVVPVVRDAHILTTGELAEALAGLTARAREGRLAPEELTGGTFTLNNYGVFGVDGSTPIINHPEAALLGVGRIVDKPWAVDGALAVRKVGQLSLTFDHRVCDGGTAGGFLRFVADCVEQPLTLLRNL